MLNWETLPHLSVIAFGHIQGTLILTYIHSVAINSHMQMVKYRVIHQSLRDFRPLRYSSRDGHAEGEHVNRGRDIPSFCPSLQVLDMSTLGDAADVNPVIKFMPKACNIVGCALHHKL